MLFEQLLKQLKKVLIRSIKTKQKKKIRENIIRVEHLSDTLTRTSKALDRYANYNNDSNYITIMQMKDRQIF